MNYFRTIFSFQRPIDCESTDELITQNEFSLAVNKLSQLNYINPAKNNDG